MGNKIKSLWKEYNMRKQEYEKIVSSILEHPEFKKRKTYMHHENESVYEHSVKVSITAYHIASILHLKNKEDIAIGALLHDFYDKPWQENTEHKKLLERHGFVHAKQAVKNAKTYFPEYMNLKVEDMILKHMFPLNIKPPRYLGSWIVTISDKLVSMNIFLHPTQLPKYIGIKKKRK